MTSLTTTPERPLIRLWRDADGMGVTFPSEPRATFIGGPMDGATRGYVTCRGTTRPPLIVEHHPKGKFGSAYLLDEAAPTLTYRSVLVIDA